MKRILKSILIGALLVAGPRWGFADTTTTRFGLTKPDIGSTNWGPKINTNYDTVDNAAGLALVNAFTNTNSFAAATTFTGQLLAANGTPVSPLYSFTNFSTSGWWAGTGPAVYWGVGGSTVAYVNSSGMTIFTGLTLTAPTLSITNNATVGGVVVHSTGTPSAPPITFTGRTSDGITSMAANEIDFVTNSSTRGFFGNGGLTMASSFTPVAIVDRNLSPGTTYDYLRSSGPATAPIWSHAGLILQTTQYFVLAPSTATSTAVFQKTGVKVTITPKFPNSLVKISFSSMLQNSNPSGDTCELTIEENASNILGTTNDWVRSTLQAAGNHNLFVAIGPYVRSPGAGTFTYEIYGRNSAGGSTCTTGSAGVTNLLVEEIGQ